MINFTSPIGHATWKSVWSPWHYISPLLGAWDTAETPATTYSQFWQWAYPTRAKKSRSRGRIFARFLHLDETSWTVLVWVTRPENLLVHATELCQTELERACAETEHICTEDRVKLRKDLGEVNHLSSQMAVLTAFMIRTRDVVQPTVHHMASVYFTTANYRTALFIDNSGRSTSAPAPHRPPPPASSNVYPIRIRLMTHTVTCLASWKLEG